MSRRRLMACALCRLLWPSLSEIAQMVVRTSEDYADGLVGEDRLRQAREVIRPQYGHLHAAIPNLVAATTFPGNKALMDLRALALQAGLSSKQIQMAFDDLTLPSVQKDAQKAAAWRTETVKSMALVMYRQRDFSGMPVLGDALEEAGCPFEELVSHCRGDVRHFRGCWVLNLILGHP